MASLRHLFLLDPDIIFLNHGSFGACPREVFETFLDWQRRLERQPVLFLGREHTGLLEQARESLAAFLHTRPENVVYIPNSTYGVNAAARSLAFKPGDEILTTNQEYGACDYTWDFICGKNGARIVRQPLQLPGLACLDFVDQLWEGVTQRTKAIYLSHITSPTAQKIPVEAVCRRAREAGILTIIDGAHAPGQIPVNLEAIGADFYFGNLHKWVMAPKGAAFLYARSEVQETLEPLVVSWGFHAAADASTGSRFLDYYQWTGTHDPAAYLTVPAAIEFAEKYAWDEVRRECRALLKLALQRIVNLTGLEDLYANTHENECLPPQMGSAYLPKHLDLKVMKERLYQEYRIEIPLLEWQGRNIMRLSVQGYNISMELDSLLAALRELLNASG